jgi:hypothetical protein
MRLPVICACIVLCQSAFSQSLTGSWYGKANAAIEGSHNNYLTELIIKQKVDEIEGILGYYFKSIYIRGRYDKKNNRVTINKIPLTYFRAASIDGVDCLMNFSANVISSRVQITMNGLFMTDPKYSYTCPEFAVNYTLDKDEHNQDSIIRNTVAYKLWQPQPDDVVVNNNPADTVAKVDSAKRVPADMEKLIASFEKRATVLSKEVEVESDSVRVSFYDNGDIDGDTISIFLNKVPVLTKQGLAAQALNVYFKLDPSKEVNEISMFAENLGKFPPNTALMVVSDGEHRYEVYLSSSLTQNASVRLRRKKK